MEFQIAGIQDDNAAMSFRSPFRYSENKILTLLFSLYLALSDPPRQGVFLSKQRGSPVVALVIARGGEPKLISQDFIQPHMVD